MSRVLLEDLFGVETRMERVLACIGTIFKLHNACEVLLFPDEVAVAVLGRRTRSIEALACALSICYVSRSTALFIWVDVGVF